MLTKFVKLSKAYLIVSPLVWTHNSEHMKLADQKLPVFSAVLMYAIFIHGYIPKTMLKYVIEG